MTKKKRLGIFGTLNDEKLKEVKEERLREIIIEKAKRVLDRKTESDEKGPYIAVDDTNAYDVTCAYHVIDSHYNVKGTLIAKLNCQRIDGSLVVNLLTYHPTST